MSAAAVGPAVDGQHPFYPVGVAMPRFVVNSMTGPALILCFAAACAVIFLATWLVASCSRPSPPTCEFLSIFWFVLCGCIHLFFEGYFSYNFLDMASKSDVFGQLWKEYSLSDSRYMTQDSFVVCMETVTAIFWGPLSFLCAFCILNRHPLRHPLQLIISLGQIYGDVLYYATCWFTKLVHGIAYSRPEPYYYWAYFVLCNSFWIVIPLLLLLQSVTQTTAAFSRAQSAVLPAKKSQ